MLDEYCASTGLERKYATKVLGGQRGRGGVGSARGARAIYGAEDIAVLRGVSRTALEGCGKRSACPTIGVASGLPWEGNPSLRNSTLTDWIFAPAIPKTAKLNPNSRKEQTLVNAKQTKEAQMLVQVDDFNDRRLADFTHNPPTAVDLKWAATRARLKLAIRELGGKAAIQASGTFSQQTEEKNTLRQDLEDEMRNYNLTAASIAEEKKNPGLMDRFRMPQGNGDGELKTKARAFAAAIRELSLNDEFAAHGHGDVDDAGGAITPDAVLDQMAEEFQTGEGVKGSARSAQAGATQAIKVHLRDGKAAVKTLEAIYSNVYKGDAEMLGAWKTASHVERTNRTAKASPAPVPAVAPAAPVSARTPVTA